MLLLGTIFQNIQEENKINIGLWFFQMRKKLLRIETNYHRFDVRRFEGNIRRPQAIEIIVL